QARLDLHVLAHGLHARGLAREELGDVVGAANLFLGRLDRRVVTAAVVIVAAGAAGAESEGGHGPEQCWTLHARTPPTTPGGNLGTDARMSRPATSLLCGERSGFLSAFDPGARICRRCCLCTPAHSGSVRTRRGAAAGTLAARH